MIYINIIIIILTGIIVYFSELAEEKPKREAIQVGLALSAAQLLLFYIDHWISISIAWLIFISGLSWYFQNRSTQKNIPDISFQQSHLPTGETLSFNYIDAHGQHSSRRIIPIECNRYHLIGYCLEKQAERSFRRDRICGNVVHEETGEILDPESRSFIKKINSLI